MEKTTFEGFLDHSDKNPDLFGDSILIRDDDGMGFHLVPKLAPLRGKYVRVTIEVLPDQPERFW